ncbi:MAG: alpha-amylase, partial [Oscillospiraceae bacterium]|nr:alpha-amylase [Oscillospiraceae bacterium]
KISVWSKFTFPGRHGTYSDFTWNHRHFTGTDWDEKAKEQGNIYRFTGKHWDQTDPEKGTFDYLMGMNVDMDNPTVVRETKKWLKWYLTETGIDGLRLDAVKHISFPFYKELLHDIREQTGLALPAVGEYWSGDIERLLHYRDAVDNEMALFDVALHYNFFHASQAGGDYDLRTILDNTLVRERPMNAVTFVDNHDTQFGQSLESFVDDWFKPLAYALILLRQEGVPCVFYSDYYGNPVKNRPLVPNLGKLIKLRRNYAYGEQIDCFESEHLIGWTRGGDGEHENSGLAVVMSNSEDGGTLHMNIGACFAGESFRDVLGNCTEPVVIGEDGWGDFRCEGRSMAIWVREGAFEDLVVNE